MDMLLPNQSKILENMQAVINDYAKAACRARGIKPYISAYCLNENEFKLHTSNGLARDIESLCNARILITVHYAPAFPGYNSALSHSIDDLYDGVWAAESIAFRELKHHEGSVQESLKKRMMHPPKPIKDRVRVSHTRFTNADSDDLFQYLVKIDNRMQNTNGKLVNTGVEGVLRFGNEIFCDTLGSEITQEISVFMATLVASAPSKDGLTRRYTMKDRIGSTGGTEILKKLEKHFMKTAENLSSNASKFAAAKDNVDGFRFVPGTYDVVLDGRVGAVSIHELGSGHLAEATRLVYENDRGEGVSAPFLGRIGEQKYLPGLNIIDAGSLKINGVKTVAYYNYDCEGTPTEETFLIKDGSFNSYLHTRLSAGTLKKKDGGRVLTGNARLGAIVEQREDGKDYTVRPEARMSNLMILPSKKPCSLDDLFHEIRGRGFFISGFPFGGVYTTNSLGIVGFNEIYFVDKNCNLVPMRINGHDTFINDSVTSYMEKIAAVGDQNTITTDTGWCGSDSGIVPHSASGAAILVKGVALEAQQMPMPTRKPLVPYNKRKVK